MGIGRIGQRGCRGKRGHSTRAYAEGQLQTLIDVGANPDLMHVYRCRRCARWHVGHRGGAQKRR